MTEVSQLAARGRDVSSDLGRPCWAIWGMTYEQLRLTQYEVVEACWVRLEMVDDYWRMVIGHRHLAGQYGDCQTEYYQELTMGEVADVIVATLGTLCHPH